MANIPRKATADIKEEIDEFTKYFYDVTFSKSGYLAGRIVKVFYNYIHPRVFYAKSNMRRYLAVWFKTTNIRGDMEKHSAFGFASFIDANYYVLTFDKNRRLHRTLHYILKKIL